MQPAVFFALHLCIWTWGAPFGPVPLTEASPVHTMPHALLASPVCHFLAVLDIAISFALLVPSLKLPSPEWPPCWQR